MRMEFAKQFYSESVIILIWRLMSKALYQNVIVYTLAVTW